MIKTLIVDDSALVRSVIRNFLESDGSFSVVGEAGNGAEAVELAQRLNPDLITMDIEMPVMNGLEAIVEIKKIMATAIVVITSHSSAKTAYQATVKGALEFYPKEIFTSNAGGQNQREVLDTLKRITGIKQRLPVAPASSAQNARIEPRRILAIVIAASTGGPKALSRLCPALPKNFPVPIILVQHNSPGFDLGFAQWLDDCAPLRVRLAEERAIPASGNLYVAPTDRHLAFGKNGFLFDDGEPVNNQKPAADVLFKSAAETYGDALASVVLTGMGCDGAEGTRHVKQAGGITIAQDEATSLVYGMPRAAAETGCVDLTLPLETIAGQLAAFAKWGEQK